MKTRQRWVSRILGNWLTSFLSPLTGMTISFTLPIEDQNVKLLLSAVIASSIVTGLVISRELEKWGNERQSR